MLRRLTTFLLLLALVAGSVLGVRALLPHPAVPGGNATCQHDAGVLTGLAARYGTWHNTPGVKRDLFWVAHSSLLRDCPLSGVAYFATHRLAPYLN